MTEPEPDRRRRRRPWPSSPLDNDDVLSEILLRLPPRPSSLPHASLVCKRWRDLVTSPRFLRDFSAFHPAAPPLLGVFHNNHDVSCEHRFVAVADPLDRVPVTRFRVPCGPDHRSLRFLDCRHGRALLLSPAPREALVWDPITGARHRAPLTPDAGDIRHGAVLCACACGRPRDCRSGPFQVVLVWWKQEAQRRRAVAAVYSSVSRAWNQIVSTQFAAADSAAGDAWKPGTLVGDAIYWLLPENCILKFDAVRRRLDLIPVPDCSTGTLYRQCQLVLIEGGSLGLAMATEVSILVWKRDCRPAATAGWTLHKSIGLERCLPLRKEIQGALPSLLGFHEDSNMIFVWINAGVFMVQLESMKSRMVCQGLRDFEIYPFAGFYNADGAGEQVTGAPEPAADDAPEDLSRLPAAAMWHYKDPVGHVRGPFSLVQLQGWNERGYFPGGFRVWRTDQTKEQAVLLEDALRSHNVK